MHIHIFAREGREIETWNTMAGLTARVKRASEKKK
jgi:hypothetical protein